MTKTKLYPIIACIAFISCDSAKKITKDVAGETVDNKVFKSQTIDLDYLNTTIRPQEDFFEFANGTWIKNNPVPASESRWGSFNELDQANKKKLTSLLEEASKVNGGARSANYILGNYYQSYIDMKKRNAAGLKLVSSKLNLVENISSKNSLSEVIADLHKAGIGALFSFGVGQDLKNVDNHIAYLSQGGIGLPNKDYYESKDKQEIKLKYTDHITRIFRLAGLLDQECQKMARSVVTFECSLAEAMMTPSELRVPENTYNKMSSADLFSQTKGLNLEMYMEMLGIDSFDSLVIGQPKFVEQIEEMIKKVELSDWKYYLKWNILNHYAGHLNQEFVQTNFDFYGTVLSGKSEMKPINERAIDEITHQEFGELLGKVFVGRYYSDVAAQKVNTMVDNLLIVFEERIQKLDWMSSETKKQALTKLNAIGRKLGYPNVWEDFSSLKFTPDSYIGNLDEAARFSTEKNLAKLYKSVNKDEWGMPAHMVNAYYHPLLNEIAFPAGIMQAPFFSEHYEDAVNYGRIGMVIGHEFTHGFDDMGSKFAADGSFTNWWSAADRKAFEERTGKLGATFDGFCPIDGHCVNSSLTMGENIADLGGLTLAYHAYTRTDEYKAGIKRKGYSPSQRFFIAYAQLWKINYTEEELKNRIANDPHSPGMYRVNGPLMNCPEFFDAFKVKKGDTMRNDLSKIAKIW